MEQIVPPAAVGLKYKLDKAADQEEAVRILCVFVRDWLSAREVVTYLPNTDGELQGFLSYRRWRGFTDASTFPKPEELDSEAIWLPSSDASLSPLPESYDVEGLFGAGPILIRRTSTGAEMGTDFRAQLQFLRAPLPLLDGQAGLIEFRRHLYDSEFTQEHARFLVDLGVFFSAYLPGAEQPSE